ncbi:tetratricopeptide repeat protein [Chloroflexi bacterium CFX2]|nr:tetratricopeptide repeat protein [Chloroflexi bacterium CFX2]
MERLRKEYLTVDVSDIIQQPLSIEARELTDAQINSANEAEPVKPIQLTAEEWFERGFVYAIEAKNYSEALHCFSEAIRLQPDFAEAHNNLGNVLSELDHYAEAEEAYRQAIAKDPNYAAAYNNLTILIKNNEQRKRRALAIGKVDRD